MQTALKKIISLILGFAFIVFLLFPLAFFILLIQIKPLGKLIWPLPDVYHFSPDTMWHGLFLLWPALVVFALFVLRNGFLKRYFSGLITKENFKIGWKITLATFLFVNLPLMVIMRAGFQSWNWSKFLVFPVNIPILGMIGNFYLKKINAAPKNILVLGWSIAWRGVLTEYLFFCIAILISWWFAYVGFAPGAAFAELIAKNAETVQALMRNPMMRSVFLFCNFHAHFLLQWLLIVYIVAASVGCFIVFTVYVPGKAFLAALKANR